MSTLNRRDFLERTHRSAVGLAAGLTILSNPRSVRAAPANDRLVLAMIGVGGGRGHSLAMGFLDRDDCEIGYICDVNRQLHEPRAEAYAARQGGKRPKCVQDFREMLTDASVDAVVIATPPHWHALATILCCRAGKDVYCEKPQSHNCWEGRQAVEAARKYNRIVQIGTQNRSAPYNFAAKRYLEEGKLGRIHLCRVHEQRYEANFQWGPDSDPPDTLDWDMWNGPAPQRKYNKAIHTQWRQLWDYAGGQMAYQGIHQLDLARWLCGVDYPSGVYCAGGRFNTQGAAETPDTQSAVVRVPQHADDLRADALYALHARERRRDSQRRHLPLLAPERHADRALRRPGRDVHGPDGRRLAGLRPAEESAAGGQGPDARPLPRRAPQGELRPVGQEPPAAQRRHRRRPPQPAAGPLRQHQLPARRPEAAHRSEDRAASSTIPRP